MTLEVTAYSGLGPGPHDVTVTSVEVKTSKAGGQYLRWEFTDPAGKTSNENSPKEMTPGNKTGRWFASLTGRPTIVGERRELSEVIGRPASIFIELQPDGYTKIISVAARQAAPAHRTASAEAVTNAEGTSLAQKINEHQEADPTPHDPDALPF